MSFSSSSITVHVPGSLMLMGEHAVLHGAPSLCMAVDRQMHLHLKPRQDRQVHLRSALGSYQGELHQLAVTPPYRFVLQAIVQAKPARGFDLDIESDFSATIGFGSSAAVTAGTVALLRALADKSFDRAAVFAEALQAVRAVQGSGSGSDVAASVYGGVVKYLPDPLQIEPLHCQLDLSVCYAGYKTPTPDVIRIVENLRQSHPERFAEIFSLMGRCTEDAVPALRAGDNEKLGQLFNLHHGLQAALGCSDEVLETLVHRLRKHPDIHGTKISGSGLGDCVIALGSTEARVEDYEHFPVQTASQGVTLEH